MEMGQRDLANLNDDLRYSPSPYESMGRVLEQVTHKLHSSRSYIDVTLTSQWNALNKT